MNKLYTLVMFGLLLSFSFATVSAIDSLDSACQYDLNQDDKVDWADYNMEYNNYMSGTATYTDVFDMHRAVRLYSRIHLTNIC